MRIYQTEISNTYIGLQLRKRRLQMGWTAHTLGKKSGLSQQQISRYERGTQNFTIHRLCIFANVLQCDLDYFLEQNIYENLSLVDINL
ncbi:helix-turn-helix transcriptional regulator [Providencia huaxiensis]|uniref:Helix-turn-helix domain-containing protein n=1 Tax=Providencia huaxiensis TaxID=2027290 RepID=A0A345LWW6_9GAMM|nr:MULTISPECIES: helix-turn-helix transcriptional regulator [Providencia]MBZ3683221.1 helix-turn-helix transcriptional regulator [Providencia rettgeri]AXH62606.1 helix-turn-helix transcriptional regulator [Providencia huaxiensis]MBQ0270558.1 helix-turn-helix transcriptional regulator [Providencia huaxiensis]MDT0132544.1 helix-turn-helix domain-containing protein [Providencia huaxiensis]MDT1978950.1 helix-turn-helix domain-containing protein [Providencia huaxiensis]